MRKRSVANQTEYAADNRQESNLPKSFYHYHLHHR